MNIIIKDWEGKEHKGIWNGCSYESKVPNQKELKRIYISNTEIHVTDEMLKPFLVLKEQQNAALKEGARTKELEKLQNAYKELARLLSMDVEVIKVMEIDELKELSKVINEVTYLLSGQKDKKKMQIITAYENESSGYCRGHYEYNIEKMDADLLDFLSEQDNLSKEEKYELMKRWIRSNYKKYEGDFQVTRDDMDEKYCNFTVFDSEYIDC